MQSFNWVGSKTDDSCISTDISDDGSILLQRFLYN